MERMPGRDRLARVRFARSSLASDPDSGVPAASWRTGSSEVQHRPFPHTGAFRDRGTRGASRGARRLGLAPEERAGRLVALRSRDWIDAQLLESRQAPTRL